MQTFAQSLGEKPPSPERLALVQRLESATDATETVVNMTLGTTLGVAVAVNADSGTPEPMSAIRKAVDAQRDQLRAAFAEVMIVSFLYTYQNLSDHELAQYAEFYESESGRSYNRMTTRAVTTAMTTAAMRFGTALAEGLRKMAPQRRL